MSQLIITFVGVAIVIGLASLVLASSYEALLLPGVTESGPTTSNSVPTPDEIPDLIAWFDADDSSTIAIGVGVSQWDDKSGEGNHVVQSTGTKQPVVVTEVVNGKDALYFDGTGDTLQTSSGFSSGALTQPYTTVLVVQGDVDGASSGYYFDGDDSVNRVQLRDLSDKLNMNAGISLTAAESIVSDYTYLLIEFDGANSEMFRENNSILSGHAGNKVLDGLTLAAQYTGTAAYGNMTLAEFLIYDDRLTTDEKNDLTDYIETKYDLGLTITGDYSVSVSNSTVNPWSEVQTNLASNAQSATGLLVVVLIVIAAVVIIAYLRRQN